MWASEVAWMVSDAKGDADPVSWAREREDAPPKGQAIGNLEDYSGGRFVGDRGCDGAEEEEDEKEGRRRRSSS